MTDTALAAKRERDRVRHQARKGTPEYIACRRVYYEQHRDEFIARSKASHQRNRATNNARSRTYYRVHKADMALSKQSWFLENTYGLTRADLEALFNKQGGKCAICRRPGTYGRTRGGLGVDHNHATGMVRGLLCYSCNTALGLTRDSLDLLQSMMDYVRRTANE